MAERRRLPVLQEPKGDEPAGGDDEVEERPPWHWAGFGTVAIFFVWLPLTYVGGWVSKRVLLARFGEGATKEQVEDAIAKMSSGEHARLMAVVGLPNVLALAFASFCGGVIVGRFGKGGARPAAVSGAVTAVIASILVEATGVSLSTVAALLVTAAVAIGFAYGGGKVGAARRAAKEASEALPAKKA